MSATCPKCSNPDSRKTQEMQGLYRCDKCDCDFTQWQQDNIDTLKQKLDSRERVLREAINILVEECKLNNLRCWPVNPRFPCECLKCRRDRLIKEECASIAAKELGD